MDHNKRHFYSPEITNHDTQERNPMFELMLNILKQPPVKLKDIIELSEKADIDIRMVKDAEDEAIQCKIYQADREIPRTVIICVQDTREEQSKKLSTFGQENEPVTLFSKQSRANLRVAVRFPDKPIIGYSDWFDVEDAEDMVRFSAALYNQKI